MHAHTHTHCCAPNHTMSHLAASLDCCVKHSGGPMTSSAPHKAPAPVLGFESPGEGGRVEWMVCTSARTALRVTKLHGNERVCVLMRGNPVSLGRTPGFRQLFRWRPQHAASRWVWSLLPLQGCPEQSGDQQCPQTASPSSPITCL